MTSPHPAPDTQIDRKEVAFEVFGWQLTDHIGGDRVRSHRRIVCKEMARTGEVVIGQKVIYGFVVAI